MFSRYQCELCGSRLDPGEKCDCMEKKEQNRKKIESMIRIQPDGQYMIAVGGSYAVDR